MLGIMKVNGNKYHSSTVYKYKRGGQKIPRLFMVLSFHMQPSTYVIHEPKLYSIVNILISIFFFNQKCVHNNVSGRATMD